MVHCKNMQTLAYILLQSLNYIKQNRFKETMSMLSQIINVASVIPIGPPICDIWHLAKILDSYRFYMRKL